MTGMGLQALKRLIFVIIIVTKVTRPIAAVFPNPICRIDLPINEYVVSRFPVSAFGFSAFIRMRWLIPFYCRIDIGKANGNQ